jgi:hypothetical protein
LVGQSSGRDSRQKMRKSGGKPPSASGSFSELYVELAIAAISLW